MEGFALGLSAGISIGIGGGFSTGIASGRGKLQKQIRKAIEDNQVSIHDENGEPLTIEALLTFLDKNYKKVRHQRKSNGNINTSTSRPLQ